MSQMNYTVDLGIAGEVELIVKFDYQPQEKRTYWYPGCDESYDVYEVTTKDGKDLTWMLANVLNECGVFAEAVHDEMCPEYEYEEAA